MTQRSDSLANLLGPRDSLRIVWPLLALLLFLETLYSTRWLQPDPAQRSVAPSADPPAAPSLQAILQQRSQDAPTPLKVWFAPYNTYPETGFVESTARKGVYDTFLAFPTQGGLISNYGAPKLSAADGAFAMASVLGLGQEFILASLLGYNLFAVDRAALIQPEGLTALCRRIPGCTLSGDGYALFTIASAPTALPQQLSQFSRRFQMLPLESAGPSWRSLVFDPMAFTKRRITPATDSTGITTFSIEATPTAALNIFRYPPDAYPASIRAWFKLRNEDVTLTLLPNTTQATLCIGEKPPGCQVVRLGGNQRSVAIGSLLIPGRLNRISVVDLRLRSLRENLFRIEVRSPSSFAAATASTSAP